MRDILFRGKRIDNGEWVEGYYVRHETRQNCLANDELKVDEIEHYIFYDGFSDWNMPRELRCAKIAPDTLCQYTGLTDKNGKKIWENDIVKYQSDNDDCPFPNKDTKKRIGRVYFEEFRAAFALAMGKKGSSMINNDLYQYVQNGNRVEVIGNIFDHPELLEED